ncbi:hypothetical protein [Paraburkholderia caballeronis]|uniref:hypothetical protein n=1 Tax=Paraburkholderia caballeronis TaxID=416943 RepID=UPI00106657B7|nr:hypothetical protein [Paraburkholderia caballeronis]TDV04689.1 hypothetical protein C7408_13151 [Paraburkholderia caballeronis]TDV07932.1 hypothetical protein C7406_13351 [Paraburkholderia caballeronis]TDV18223.1 hypothetical protein C7404_13151 [Paraburkholderia caballeronis]
MQAFGWTWEYVDELDLPRVDAIYRGFSRKPPVHWIAAAFVRFKPRPVSEDGPVAGPKPSETFTSFGGRLLDE